MSETPKNKGFIFEIYDLMNMICYSSIIVFVLAILFFRPVQVTGISMEPTFQDADKILIRGFLYKPKHSDVVVVDTTNSGLQHSHVIKRVIACAGDTIDLDPITGEVSVNGELLDEPYISDTINMWSFGDFTYPLTVEEGKIFVMGDNRNDSLDSRFAKIGQVDERYVNGKVIFRYFPFNNMGSNFK